MKVHKAALLFPLLAGDELQALADDIKLHGLRHPIVIDGDGVLLDGRNRLAACKLARVEPRTITVRPRDPIAYIVGVNCARRHLTPSERAVIAVKMLPLLEAQAKERMRKGGNSAGVGRQKVDSPRKATEAAAKATGTNRQYVSDAKKLAATEPALFKDVATGKKTLTEAKRAARENKREQRRQANAAWVASVPSPELVLGRARFSTIVADPPWDVADEGDVNHVGRGKPDYAAMSIDAIRALPVGELADEDCHLYLWITNRSLPKGFGLLEAWGFRYVTMLTWVKPSYGLGSYFRGQTEHVLFGVRGSQMLLRRDVGTVFHAPRGDGGHSSKPAAFYELVESCSPGPRLDMFSRTERDGWARWGQDDARAA